MKIISKFHDYYDINAIRYGPDPKIILDRIQTLDSTTQLRIADEDVFSIPKSYVFHKPKIQLTDPLTVYLLQHQVYSTC